MLWKNPGKEVNFPNMTEVGLKGQRQKEKKKGRRGGGWWGAPAVCNGAQVGRKS